MNCLNFQIKTLSGSFPYLRNPAALIILKLVLEGRRIAPGASPGRKVRTPQGVMPRNSGLTGDTRGRKVGRLSDGKCHRKSDRHWRKPVARVKRCGKSAPREAQATRHGKPHRVQGQIGNRGAARSGFRESETGFGYRSLRQMILSAARRRQNSAYSPSKTILDFRRDERVPFPKSQGLVELVPPALFSVNRK